jgi:hypothetical protein
MRRHAPLGAILVLLAILAGCHTNGDVKTPESRDLPDIFGVWTWTRSTGGIAGVDRTPENSGERWSVEFRKDGTYREVRNGVERNGRFTIEKRQSIFDHEMRPALVIEGRIDAIIARPGADQLGLSDNVYDGFNSTFTKAR